MNKSHIIFSRMKFFDCKNKKLSNGKNKLIRFLESNSGHHVGECLKYELVPFKSFPPDRSPTKTLYIICKDCNKEVIAPKCAFCDSPSHTMDDAVLFYVGSHDKAYKEGKKTFLKYMRY